MTLQTVHRCLMKGPLTFQQMYPLGKAVDLKRCPGKSSRMIDGDETITYREYRTLPHRQKPEAIDARSKEGSTPLRPCLSIL